MDLNIRDFPKDLHEKITRAAFDQKKTLKEFVIDFLQALCDDKPAGLKRVLTDDSNRAKAKKAKAPSGKKKAAAGGGKQKGVRTCPTHNKPMKDYGNKWMCDGPPAHSELK